MRYTDLANQLNADQAMKLIEAFAPLLDKCAEVKPLPSALHGKFGFEHDRWELWLFYRALKGVAGYYGELNHRTCDRPTKKGLPCQRKVRWGRVACAAHITPLELEVARRWQEANHLPFPRVSEEQVENFKGVHAVRTEAAQRKQAQRLNRDLARIATGLETGKAPSTYIRTEPHPQPAPEPYLQF